MVMEVEDFVEVVEPRLRAALVGRYGPSTGRAVTVDALSYAWEHWDRLQEMENPVGYLFRVGQSAARRYGAQPAPWTGDDVADASLPAVEPGLGRALAQLSERQRTVVFLVHAMQWTHQEVAELLDVTASTVQTHVERALVSLRQALEVPDAR